MAKYVVAGGTGFVGSAVVDHLIKLGHEVVVLTRKGAVHPRAQAVNWNMEAAGPWTSALEGADGLVNLVGHPIAIPWNKENRKLILESRVQSVKALGEAVRKCQNGPKVWVNASAVGYYGDTGDKEVTEAQPAGKRGFLTDTAAAWEQVFSTQEAPGVRKNAVRIGLVLGRSGGALPQLVRLTKMFLGGAQGSGSQHMAWIHIDDVARVITLCLDREMPFAVNAVAPVPCTNRFFSATLRAIVGRPWCPGIPTFLLRIASWFGAPDPALMTTSCRAVPAAVLATGFRFNYEEVRDALLNLLK